jgi:hypothetical protein
MADDPEKVEISAADLKVLQAAYNTLNGLWTNPKHGLAIKRMVKDVKPDTSIPELDIAERYAEPLRKDLDDSKAEMAKLREEMAKDKKERDEKEQLRGVYAKIDDVVKKRGLTDEGKAGLIKTMQDRQIADPEAAALVYLDSIPKPQPQVKGQAYLPQSMNMYGMDDGKESEFAAFWENPVKAQDNMIAKIINEGLTE